MWAENNYGQPGPITVTNTTPGMQEIKLGGRDGCHRAWESDQVRVPSVVSKVSARSGLIYTYTHPFQPSNGPESWYITAVNARTGHVVWSRLAGVGPDYNNFYAPVTIGPDGTLYVGAIGGIVELRGPPREDDKMTHRASSADRRVSSRSSAVPACCTWWPRGLREDRAAAARRPRTLVYVSGVAELGLRRDACRAADAPPRRAARARACSSGCSRPTSTR